MTNVIKSERGGIYLVESDVGSPEEWIPRGERRLKKFNKWARKNKLKTGDIIPKRRFRKCWKKLKYKNK